MNRGTREQHVTCRHAWMRGGGTHRQLEPVRVHGLVERPGELVSPQTLHQGLLEVLQLVGHAAGPTRILYRGLWGRRRRLGHCVRQGGALKVLVQQGGLADALA